MIDDVSNKSETFFSTDFTYYVSFENIEEKNQKCHKEGIGGRRDTARFVKKSRCIKI